MPYIKQVDRDALINGNIGPMNPGQLNFVITTIVDKYVKDIAGPFPLRYVDLNEAIGALECAKLELYRRVAVPYEDKKLKENGEVYTCVTI